MENQERIKGLGENWRTLHRQMPDIAQDSYTIEGLSHLVGIPRDVIVHEISTGELKAVRCGPRTICLDRADVIAWLRSRGPGI